MILEHLVPNLRVFEYIQTALTAYTANLIKVDIDNTQMYNMSNKRMMGKSVLQANMKNIVLILYLWPRKATNVLILFKTVHYSHVYGAHFAHLTIVDVKLD